MDADPRIAVLGGGDAAVGIARLLAASGWTKVFVIDSLPHEAITLPDAIEDVMMYGVDLASEAHRDLTSIAMIRDGVIEDVRLLDAPRMMPEVVVREYLRIEREPVDFPAFYAVDRRDHPTSPKATLRAQRPQRQRQHKKARKR